MKNFLHGRESLKSVVAKSADSGTPKSALSKLSGEPQNHSHDGSIDPGAMPEVNVISENGRVQRIIVTCTCGKNIELECQY